MFFLSLSLSTPWFNCSRALTTEETETWTKNVSRNFHFFLDFFGQLISRYICSFAVGQISYTNCCGCWFYHFSPVLWEWMSHTNNMYIFFATRHTKYFVEFATEFQMKHRHSYEIYNSKCPLGILVVSFPHFKRFFFVFCICIVLKSFAVIQDKRTGVDFFVSLSLVFQG